MGNTAVSSDPPKLSPMLVSYLDYKAKYPDALLLFQVGDFYETFFDDAVKISKALNLTLTTRDKNSPEPVPMAGVPIGVVDSYLDRLVDQGFSVALVSQTGAPTNGKGMFERKLERIVTPGVRVLSNTGSDKGDQFLAAVHVDTSSEGAVAFTNVQSGIIWVREHLTGLNLNLEIARIGPNEIITPRGSGLAKKLSRFRDSHQISLKERTGELTSGSRRELMALEGYGRLAPAAKRAVRLLVNYIDETTVGVEVLIREIRIASDSISMVIDASTRANLELTRNLRDGGVEGTLFSVLNFTKTAAGERFLKASILNPLVELESITGRLETVRFLKSEHETRRELREALGFVADLERISARIELKSIMPRELGALRDSLDRIPLLSRCLSGLSQVPEKLSQIASALVTPPGVAEELRAAITDEPPLSSTDGGIIRDGFNEEVDRLREIKLKGHAWIAEIEAKERIATGITSLKIKYNNVIGYFFEVTKTNLTRVPEHFIRRQSTVAGERYTTTELAQREQEVSSAEAKLFALERKLFEEIREKLRNVTGPLRALSLVVAELDLVLALAEAADLEGWNEPQIDESQELSIVQGRHPVLGKLLHGTFVPNSLTFAHGEKRCAILTGPNMGGKSTFLRQAALIVIMAQLGSFIPAESAKIGIVDRIFARIGASDNMLEGESTFMVEMREASHIVAHATERSLILIDELGRGTATADGLSLARSILEWLVLECKSRTLFATHFHELTQLEASYPAVINLSVGSQEIEGEVVFTHQISPGAANKSYGLEVARLSGLPGHLIDRARGYLAEMHSARENVSRGSTQLSIFGASEKSAPAKIVEPADYRELVAIKKKIKAIDVDGTTPREALQILSDLHQASSGRTDA